MITLILFVLSLVAWWKIFEKMGEPGWKGLIPIYNIYIICQKLSGNMNVFICYAVLYALSIFITADSFLFTIVNLGLIITNLIIYHKLSKAFGHGALFTAGLVLLSPIFHYILAFGKSEYIGPQY